MKFITFQKPNLYYLFFIAYFATIIVREFIAAQITENLTKSTYLFRMWISTLSHILSVIPFLIIKYRSKSSNDSNEKIKLSSKINFIIGDRINKYKGKNVCKHTLLTSVFSFLSEAVLYTFYFVNDKPEIYRSYSLSIYMITNCVILYITSYFILKTFFYKHHYLSLSINFFCFLIDLIIDIIQIIKQEITEYRYYIYIIVKLIRLTFLCVFDCYAKFSMLESFLSPYSLLAYMSLYESIFLLIYSTPFFFISIEEYDGTNDIIFKGFLNYLTGNKLLYSILSLLNNYISDLSLIYIIDKFSPSHLTLALTLESFFKDTYYIIKYKIEGENVYWNRYVDFGVFLALIIGSMIHNEIFIINKWGLNKKTKLFLNKEFHEENVDVERFLTSDELDENEEKKENVNDNELTNNK